jgi:hypothetical protein
MSEQNKTETSQDFEVVILSNNNNKDEPTIITASDITEEWLLSAMQKYDATNQQYTTYLKDGSTSSDALTPELIESLSESPQSDINKIMRINQIIRKLINKNDIVGKTVESIETNVNTEIKLSYPNAVEGRNKTIKFEKAKQFVEDFNDQINIKNLIRTTIPTVFAEGTYVMYLRHKDNGEYIVDYYPLGVVEISDYNIGGKPVVLFDINELRNRLTKVYKKNKKNKALFFEKIEEEVKANYPEEVYKAFIDKERYAKLDVNYTGVIRIGNLNRKYGLSPIFRALNPIMMLDTFENSDRVNSKAKAKKIIFQKLRKETLGQSLDKKGFEEMAYAHDNFMLAWKQPTVVVTAPPQVEDIKYVESKTELTDVNAVNNYRSKVLNTLGIGFLMDSSSQSVSTASISVTQLLRNINKITEQLEEILQRWYKLAFTDNGFDMAYCPKIQIIDSEQLEAKIKLEMATFLYTTLNASLETVYDLVGLDVNDEAIKRKSEKENGFDKIFTPRATSYNSKGSDDKNNPDNDAGRPDSEEETDKTKYDDEYNKTRT